MLIGMARTGHRETAQRDWLRALDATASVATQLNGLIVIRQLDVFGRLFFCSALCPALSRIWSTGAHPPPGGEMLQSACPYRDKTSAGACGASETLRTTSRTSAATRRFDQDNRSFGSGIRLFGFDSQRELEQPPYCLRP